ncbi:MAG: GDSL-type esterase/lipase family protein [Planctomycetota bacterium]
MILFLLEIVLRLVGFEFALYPTEVQFGWPDPYKIKEAYQIDKELLWIPRDYDAKISSWSGKSPSIVYMGCSCTEFGRYDKFFESIIDKQHPDNNFTFVNVGVGGWSTYQGLQQLKRDVLPMKPRIATIFYGWNDHWCSFGIEDKDIGKLNLDHSIWLLYLSKLRFVQLINKAVFSFQQNGDGRMPERVSLEDFASNLLQMVRIARENDIIPVLLTAPTPHEKGKEPAYLTKRWLNDLRELVPLHQKYLQVVRDIASKEDVLLVDLYAEFRRFPREKWSRFFSRDGIHLTAAGNRKVAELMYMKFVKHDLNKLLIEQ